MALADVAQWIERWPVNQRSPVRFPVRTYAWAAGQIQLMFFSLSPSLLPLSKNK